MTPFILPKHRQNRIISFVLFISIFLFFFSCQDKSPYSDLLQKYIEPYSPSADIDVVGVPSPSWALGLKLYEEGKIDEAEKVFSHLTPGNPFYYKAHFALASYELEKNHPWKALDHLKSIRTNPNNKYFQKAQWLQALAYLQANIPAKTKDILNAILKADAHTEKARAKALLADLQKR